MKQIPQLFSGAIEEENVHKSTGKFAENNSFKFHILAGFHKEQYKWRQEGIKGKSQSCDCDWKLTLCTLVADRKWWSTN